MNNAVDWCWPLCAHQCCCCSDNSMLCSNVWSEAKGIIYSDHHSSPLSHCLPPSLQHQQDRITFDSWHTRHPNISVECRGKREERERYCRWLCHFGQWKPVQLLVILVSTVVAMDIFKPIWPDLWLILSFLVNSKLAKNHSVCHTVVFVLVCLL